MALITKELELHKKVPTPRGKIPRQNEPPQPKQTTSLANKITQPINLIPQKPKELEPIKAP